MLMTIAENIGKIKKEIKTATLVVVTKTQPVEKVIEAINSGITDIGENRVEEAFEKIELLEKYNLLEENLRKKVKWHMIGHLQTNKVKTAIEIFDMIQSVDSFKLAKEIDRQCKKINKIMPVLIEVNISGEKQKYGIKPEEVFSFLELTGQLDNIKVKGLMCMAPFFEPGTIEKTRPYFKELYSLFKKTNLEILSMGMSNDYRIAVEEGSNMVRIGTAIFR